MAKIACIGTRNISTEVYNKLVSFGEMIVMRGHQLHTGNAIGSDAAFASGGNKLPQYVHLHLPWSGYNAEAINSGNIIYTSYLSSLSALASSHHPAWSACSQGTKKLLTRNASIVSSSDIVVYFVNDDAASGGTAHGLRIAAALGRPQLRIKPDIFIERLYQEFFEMESALFSK